MCRIEHEAGVDFGEARPYQRGDHTITIRIASFAVASRGENTVLVIGTESIVDRDFFGGVYNYYSLQNKQDKYQ